MIDYKIHFEKLLTKVEETAIFFDIISKALYSDDYKEASNELKKIVADSKLSINEKIIDKI